MEREREIERERERERKCGMCVHVLTDVLLPTRYSPGFRLAQYLIVANIRGGN